MKIILIFLIVALVLLWAIIARSYYVTTLKRFRRALNNQSESTIIYDYRGRPFHTLSAAEARQYVPIDRISPHMLKTTLAVEDARFFRHFGFDPVRIIHSLFTVIIPGQVTHGASTITQQLAKLTLFSSERTLERKIKEFFAALVLELAYEKEQILEFYLNRVYLGSGNYGVERAARSYFKKPAAELTLAESALLAGLLKKPEGYSPYHPNCVKPTLVRGRSDCLIQQRRDLILRRLRTLEWISPIEYRVAKRSVLHIGSRKNRNAAPYFANHVLLRLIQTYGSGRVYNGGLQVHTTLDLDKQSRLEAVINEQLKNDVSFEQVAAVSIEPQTGAVRALVGGVDFEESEFNRVTQARRQPGSSYKAILFAAALENGLRAEDIFIDEPIEFTGERLSEEGEYALEVYQPRNYGDRYLGELNLREALRHSSNAVSVKILDYIGANALNRTSRKFGIPLDSSKGLCLALGCWEVTPLQLTSAYTVFANGGYKRKPLFVRKVLDQNDTILEERAPNPSEFVLDPPISATMHEMLREVVLRGTGQNAYIDGAAGKTGTNNDFRDAWFIGYTKMLVTGIWIGNDDNHPMRAETGGQTPAILWRRYMQSLNE